MDTMKEVFPDRAIFTYAAMQKLIQAEFEANKVRHLGFGITIDETEAMTNVKLNCDSINPFDQLAFSQKIGRINEMYPERGMALVTRISEDKISLCFYIYVSEKSFKAMADINRAFDSTVSIEFSELALHVAGEFLDPVDVSGLEIFDVTFSGEDTTGKTIN
ncbi:MAG: hypothetical protein ACTS9Y_00155 [Methylophilus sp.]|uniref:hypothetical protein n=1 Tax=Methylophilus sp. TaxID=29541 RepID=UPI003FA14EF9